MRVCFFLGSCLQPAVLADAAAGTFGNWHGAMTMQRQPLRSFLFAPGNLARRVEKALSLDADAVILDLEDAVATAEKPAIREAVAAAFGGPRRGWLYVRVNAADTNFCYGDLVAIVKPGLDGVILGRRWKAPPRSRRSTGCSASFNANGAYRPGADHTACRDLWHALSREMGGDV